MKPGDLLGGPAKAIAKMAFRDLKVLVEKQIRELEAQIADLEKNLTAEQKVLAGLFAQRMRIVTRRDEASDALAAVRRARESLSACLARACGPASITRPVIPDYYAPPPGMSRFDLAPHWGWGNALRDLNPKLAANAVALARRFTVRDYCPPGGGTFTDPGGGGGVTGTGGDAGGPAPRNVVTTPCRPCQPIADRIARILDAIEALQQENAAIRKDLAQLEYLRAKLALERRRLASLQEQARGLREAIRGGNVLGLNVAGSARQSLTLVESQIVAVRGEVIFLENEIGASRPRAASFDATRPASRTCTPSAERFGPSSSTARRTCAAPATGSRRTRSSTWAATTRSTPSILWGPPRPRRRPPTAGRSPRS